VDVHAEDELAPRHVLELVDEPFVAVAGGDALPLEQAEGVRPGRPEPEVLLPGDPDHVSAQLPQRGRDVAGRAADGRRDFERRLHQLGVDARGELVPVHGLQHRLHVLHEVERLGIEEHVFLLHTERVRVSLAEPVVEDARLLAGEARALTRY
jgi:hypothetical protein